MMTTANQVLPISALASMAGVPYMTAHKRVRDGVFGDPAGLPRSNGKFYLIPRALYQAWIDDNRPRHGKDNHSS